jgi:hypothetical protein
MPELKLREVPLSYLSVIRLVEMVTGTPVFLAGGAVRDTMHGVEVKDLDVFLSYTKEAFDTIVFAFQNCHRYQMITAETADYMTMSEVQAVLGYDLPNIQVNIIFLKEGVPCTLHDVITRCDFGLCQIGCDVDGKVLYTEAFLTDAVNKTFTNTRFGDEPRALNRFDRLVKKYPGYRLINATQDDDNFDFSDLS